MTEREVLIELDKLTKRFVHRGKELTVLDAVDLKLYAGDMVAIMGSSGAGKSTLLQLIGTLDVPTGGRLLFGGEDIFKRSSSRLAQFRNEQIGFVFQFHHLLPEFDALENVMMPGLVAGKGFAEMRPRAEHLLSEVGLLDRLRHPVGKLSGGERQRVAVARALVLEPSLLLADEPTGNLDPDTAQGVLDLLLEMNRQHGTALVVVTHSQGLADRLDRRVVLRDGRLEEQS